MKLSLHLSDNHIKSVNCLISILTGLLEYEAEAKFNNSSDIYIEYSLLPNKTQQLGLFANKQ